MTSSTNKLKEEKFNLQTAMDSTRVLCVSLSWASQPRSKVGDPYPRKLGSWVLGPSRPDSRTLRLASHHLFLGNLRSRVKTSRSTLVIVFFDVALLQELKGGSGSQLAPRLRIGDPGLDPPGQSTKFLLFSTSVLPCFLGCRPARSFCFRCSLVTPTPFAWLV